MLDAYVVLIGIGSMQMRIHEEELRSIRGRPGFIEISASRKLRLRWERIGVARRVEWIGKIGNYLSRLIGSSAGVARETRGEPKVCKTEERGLAIELEIVFRL